MLNTFSKKEKNGGCEQKKALSNRKNINSKTLFKEILQEQIMSKIRWKQIKIPQPLNRSEK